METFIFSPVATVLRDKYSGISVSGEYKDSPSRFPAVTITETDNSVYGRMSTLKLENAARLMYEVNVFSNQVATAKLEARDIMETLDAEFERLGFVRTMMSPTPNMADATIYRITARYEAVADTDFWIYTS